MPLKAKIQEGLIKMLEKRYTGIREVVGLLDKVRQRVEKQRIAGLRQEHSCDDGQDKQPDSNGGMVETTQDGDILIGYKDSDEVDSDQVGIFKPEDGKWRPVVGTLGLIYKLQKVSDDGWYDTNSVFINDKEKVSALVDLLGHFWSRSCDIAANIKGEEEEELRKNLANGMELPLEDVLYVFNKDAVKADVEDHCPDIALTIDHPRKELVLTVCGTKVFPVPSAADIIMDLYADCVPFHHGRAHRGMATACNNILVKVLDLMVDKLTELKDYKLMIVGYSLGAGVAQLLALRLSEGPEQARLPAGADMQCVTFGAPPVYASSEPGYVNSSITSVYNHNDGLASLSLHTVTRLFLQIRAINKLCLGRRQTFKLLRSKLGQSTTEGGTRKFLATSADNRMEGWSSVASAIEAVYSTGFTRLTHMAGTTYLMKRGEVGHVVRRLEGLEAEPLSQELRLRAGMFNDHMPWGYNALFKGCGGCSHSYSLDMLKYM